MPAATDNAVAASTEVKRFVKATNGATTTGAGAPPPEHEHLPCPRCDSTNTKFCYYNNYNFSQPRHFCKACRRYWTHGGTLRDIPIGGGTRKNAKRSRTSATVVCPISGACMLDHHNSHTTHPLPATPALVPLMGSQGHFGDGKGSSSGSALNSTVCGSFTSLLNTQGPGFLALGGFGLGLGNGFEDVGFGLGRAVWPFPGVGDGGAGGGHGGVSAGGGSGGISHGWQFDQNGSENGFAGVGDCFSWPDLAISTPGNGLK